MNNESLARAARLECYSPYPLPNVQVSEQSIKHPAEMAIGSAVLIFLTIVFPLPSSMVRSPLSDSALSLQFVVSVVSQYPSTHDTVPGPAKVIRFGGGAAVGAAVPGASLHSLVQEMGQPSSIWKGPSAVVSMLITTTFPSTVLDWPYCSRAEKLQACAEASSTMQQPPGTHPNAPGAVKTVVSLGHERAAVGGVGAGVVAIVAIVGAGVTGSTG